MLVTDVLRSKAPRLVCQLRLALALALAVSGLSAVIVSSTAVPAAAAAAAAEVRQAHQVVSPAASAETESLFVPVSPARLVDTRETGGRIPARGTRTVRAAGNGGLPSSGVAAVVVNLTVTGPVAPGFLTAYPTGASRPEVSSVNYAKAQTVASQAIVEVDASGSFTLYGSAATDAVVDVTGYFPTGAAYAPSAPARVLDTRTGSGATMGVVKAGGVVRLKVAGVGGVPASGAGAVVLNVTDTASTGPGFVTAYPDGAARPTTSTLNYARAQTASGMTIAQIGNDGYVDLYTSAASHLVADVAGWFPIISDYTPLTPVRTLDTRTGTGRGGVTGQLKAGRTIDLQVAGLNGIPATDDDPAPTAVEVTVTATKPTAGGFVTAYPSGVERPGSSTVNYAKAQTVANSATVGVGGDGKITLYSPAATDVIVDVVGYYHTAAPGGSDGDGPGGGAGYIDGQRIKDISAGWDHTCAVTTAGAAYCWGNNSYGQIGNGTNDSAATPQPVTGLSAGVATITTGHDYTCAVTTSGAAYCWGYNAAGDLGIGSTDTSADVAITPQPVTGLSTGVATITAGYAHTCALTISGSGYCWGDNDYGQLGNDITTDGPTATPQPVSGLSTGVTITAGSYHTCAVTTNGAAYCWGDNYFGQLGTTPAPAFPDGPISTPARHAEARTTPQPVTGLSAGVTTITANYDHTCAVSTGAAKCWGANYHGQLGTGTTDAAGTPQPVTGLSAGVTTITAGYDHTCAVTTTGAAKCWGYNEHGQLGNGTTVDAPTPTPQPVTGLSTGAATITAGTFYTCAVGTNGDAKCWGDNYSGQFGNGTATNATTPQPIRTSPS